MKAKVALGIVARSVLMLLAWVLLVPMLAHSVLPGWIALLAIGGSVVVMYWGLVFRGWAEHRYSTQRRALTLVMLLVFSMVVVPGVTASAGTSFALEHVSAAPVPFVANIFTDWWGDVKESPAAGKVANAFRAENIVRTGVAGVTVAAVGGACIFTALVGCAVAVVAGPVLGMGLDIGGAAIRGKATDSIIISGVQEGNIPRALTGFVPAAGATIDKWDNDEPVGGWDIAAAAADVAFVGSLGGAAKIVKGGLALSGKAIGGGVKAAATAPVRMSAADALTSTGAKLTKEGVADVSRIVGGDALARAPYKAQVAALKTEGVISNQVGRTLTPKGLEVAAKGTTKTTGSLTSKQLARAAGSGKGAAPLIKTATPYSAVSRTAAGKAAAKNAFSPVKSVKLAGTHKVSGHAAGLRLRDTVRPSQWRAVSKATGQSTRRVASQLPVRVGSRTASTGVAYAGEWDGQEVPVISVDDTEDVQNDVQEWCDQPDRTEEDLRKCGKAIIYIECLEALNDEANPNYEDNLVADPRCQEEYDPEVAEVICEASPDICEQPGNRRALLYEACRVAGFSETACARFRDPASSIDNAVLNLLLENSYPVVSADRVIEDPGAQETRYLMPFTVSHGGLGASCENVRPFLEAIRVEYCATDYRITGVTVTYGVQGGKTETKVWSTDDLWEEEQRNPGTYNPLTGEVNLVPTAVVPNGETATVFADMVVSYVVVVTNEDGGIISLSSPIDENGDPVLLEKSGSIAREVSPAGTGGGGGGGGGGGDGGPDGLGGGEAGGSTCEGLNTLQCAGKKTEEVGDNLGEGLGSILKWGALGLLVVAGLVMYQNGTFWKLTKGGFGKKPKTAFDIKDKPGFFAKLKGLVTGKKPKPRLKPEVADSGVPVLLPPNDDHTGPDLGALRKTLDEDGDEK